MRHQNSIGETLSSNLSYHSVPRKNILYNLEGLSVKGFILAIIIYGLVTAEDGIDLVYILVVEFLAFSAFIQTNSFKIQANGGFLVRQLLPYIKDEREPRVRLYWDWICRRGEVCGICCSNCQQQLYYGYNVWFPHEARPFVPYHSTRLERLARDKHSSLLQKP
jgi:hypothetical protein